MKSPKTSLESYAKAEFFTKLPDIEDEIKVVTYVAAEGDISTDLMSPGNQAHSRADRELHGKCFISEAAQAEIRAMQTQHPDKQVMMIAEKGTMGVGSSRMSGINNVALWMGKPGQPLRSVREYCPDRCRDQRYLADFRRRRWALRAVLDRPEKLGQESRLRRQRHFEQRR